MINLIDMMDKEVRVTFRNYAGEVESTFEGKVHDVNPVHKNIWVDRYEDGELIDTYLVDLKDPKKSIEVIEVEEIRITTYNEIKGIKKELKKALRWVEEEITVRVMIYDSDEEGEQTWDVEVNYYLDGGYENGFINQTFYGDTEKEATKRAKTVLRTVKGWFENDEVTVDNEIEVYHA